MIPRRYIEEWRATANWPQDAQIEQDLVIARAIVEIFSNDFLASKLAFRGGTALHKLFILPQPRYSEDIDLVQITAEPIKEIFDQLREVLQFLGDPYIRQKANNNTAIFHFDSEIQPIINLKLKIEINCREHFSALGYTKIPFAVQSGWYAGTCDITTYQFEELMGTKLRALYQRKKGRDLFDIYKALLVKNVNCQKILDCYYAYMQFDGKKAPSQKEFALNLEAKMNEPEFLTDITALLRPGENYKPHAAFELLNSQLIAKMRP